MITTLDRMFLVSYFRSYAIVWTSLIGLYVVLDLFTHLDDFVNKPGGFGQAWLEKEMRAGRIDKEDLLDDLMFNEIIWKAVKGVNSPVPPPVRAAFFVPVKAGKKDDDD